MNKKLILALMIPMFLLSVFAFTMRTTAAPTVNIGLLAPFYLTEGGGGTNGYGGTIDGAKLAVGQINAAGGINVGGTKEQINLDVQDEGAYDLVKQTYNLATTDASMTEMLGKDQFIIGGFRTETTTEALIDLASYNSGATSPVPFFICGSSTTDLIGSTINGADAPWVFRITPMNDTQLFLTVASYIQEELAPKLAKMYCDSTHPAANPGQFAFAVIAEGLTWTQEPMYLLTAPPEAGPSPPATPGYNYFLGPNVTTNGVTSSAGNFPGGNTVTPGTTYDFTTLVSALKREDVHLIIDIFTLPEVNDLITAVQSEGMQAMIVGIDVPGQQQSHWSDTGGTATTVAACAYEVNLLWSGTNTPVVTGPAHTPGDSGSFWTDFETYTASLPATPGAAAGPYWPMYTASGAYEAIYALKAMIEKAGTTDTSNPALLAAIDSYTGTSLSGQFRFDVTNDVYAEDYGINWTQYDSTGWGWARSCCVQWIQNTTVPSSPAPDVGAQMNVVDPINLVNSTGQSMELLYAKKTQIPPTMYSLAPYDIELIGKVNMLDIGVVAKAFGTRPGDPRWNLECDVNNDGVINMVDIGTVARHFGQSAPEWPLP
jgi:ABC-type branched-subunit amino acid transport system substrate-binding protein